MTGSRDVDAAVEVPVEAGIIGEWGWTQVIWHTSDQWDRRSNDPAPGLPPYKELEPLL